MTAVALLVVCASLGCGGSTESRLADIQALHDAGEFNSSIQPLRSLLAADPDHPEANYLLGVALVQTHQPSLAIWPLRKAADSQPYAVQAGMLLASTLMQMSAFEEAVKAADAVLRADPDRLFALQVRAQANVELGALERALADAQRVLELEPDSFQGFALEIMALVKLERFDETEVAILRMRANESVKNEPAVAMRTCVALAVFYRDDAPGGKEKAGPAIEDCLEEFPAEPFVIEQAQTYYDGIEEPERATALWREAVAAAPDNFGLQALLADRLVAQGQADEAERVLVAAAESFERPSAWSRLAQFYQGRGEIAKASDATQKAIEGASGDTEDLRFRAADLLVQMGELDRAEALAAAFDEVVYREMILGHVQIARHRDREALETLESALTRWPNNAAARFLAGGTAERLGQIDKALSHYREAVRADGKATDAALSLATLYLSLGRYEDAELLAGDQITKRGTRLAEAHRIGVRATAGQRRFAVAHKHLEALQKLPGHELEVALETAAVARAETGVEAGVRVIEEAGLDLTELANLPALRSLAQDNVALGRGDAALAAVGAAMERNPASAELLDLRGRVQYLSGQREVARASFEAALAAEPEFGPALAGLGQLAMEADDFEVALALLDRAAAAQPGDPNSAQLAAKIVLQRGDTVGAEARLRELVKRHPGHAFACNDLAWLLAEKGEDLDLALDLAQRAARLDARPEILDTLGWAQLKSGDAGAAVATFERALSAQPEAASVRYRLGMALKALDRPAEALAALRTALESGGFPEAAAARTELARLEEAR